MHLLPKVRELQKTAPDDAFNVLVINRTPAGRCRGTWRDIKSVHYTTTIPETLDARVIIAEPEMKTALEAQFCRHELHHPDLFGLRPGVMLNLMDRTNPHGQAQLRMEQEKQKKNAEP